MTWHICVSGLNVSTPCTNPTAKVILNLRLRDHRNYFFSILQMLRQEEEDRPLGVDGKGERDSYDLMEGGARAPFPAFNPLWIRQCRQSPQQDAQG